MADVAQGATQPYVPSKSRSRSAVRAETTHEQVVAIKEVARRLSLSLRAVRTLLAAGELPYVQISKRRIGVLESDLAAFINARRVPGRTL